jgi:ElaA protein
MNNMVTIDWELQAFKKLTPGQLYKILQLRNEVFIVEQNCVYQDADNKDQRSFHLMGWNENNLVAYTRILPEGVGFAEASIGRVVTSPKARRTGIGRLLMEESIRLLYELYGKVPIRIGAQRYLEKFYSDFGFQKCSDEYLEDGIPHVEMILL